MSGGVHIGTGPELAAARLGTEDMAGVGAFMLLASPAPGANDDAVATLETELLLVGLPGRAGTNELGDAGKPAEGWRCMGAGVGVDPVMLVPVGVGVGVEWFDCAAPMLIAAGICRVLASGPVYFSPSSPAANVIDEQNPSDEVMSSVAPSLDLVQLVMHHVIRNDYLPGNVGKRSKVQVAHDA